MQVILREDVAALGKAGEVVKVREGYARNFLLPQKKAIVADGGSLASLAHHKKAIALRQTKEKAKYIALAEQLATIHLKITREVGEAGKLYGAVTSKDIFEALSKEKIIVDRRSILLQEPIKQAGTYEVEIRLHAEVKGVVKLDVKG